MIVNVGHNVGELELKFKLTLPFPEKSPQQTSPDIYFKASFLC